MQGISRVAEDLLTSHESLYSIELVMLENWKNGLRGSRYPPNLICSFVYACNYVPCLTK
jgi:hypothetical protein